MNSQDQQPDFPDFDFDMTRLFLVILKGQDPNCWQVFRDNREKGTGRPANFHGSWDEVEERLVMAQQQGCGIFLTINRTDGLGRRAENVVAATAVFVDGDGLPLPTDWAIPPHIIVQRDELHWHAYWLIEPTDDLATWTRTQKRLAKFLGTDPKISDPARVMRVPGFVHQKGEPMLVKLLQCPTIEDLRNGSVQRYTLEQLEAAYPGELKGTDRTTLTSSTQPVEQIPLVEWDLAINIEEAIEYLKHEAPAAVQTQHGDDQTYHVAARLKDIGVSEHKALELMAEHWNPRCTPPWTRRELGEKVAHAFRYAHQNQPGCESPLVNQQSAKARRLREVLDGCIWAVDAKCFLRRADCTMWDKDQFHSMYGHLTGGSLLSTYIFKRESLIRRFERLTYQPGKPEFPEDGTYNIWRPSGVEPKEGEVQWFLVHMEYLIPDKRERNLVLDYLAFLVQHPGEKIHFALVLQGLPGSGKSFIGQLMERIIGEGNTSRPSNEELHSQWTGWQRQAQLVIVEELMTIGRQELINKLKSVITDETIRIQEKYRNTYTLNNCLNFLMFTNHKGALKLELHDRRFFVVFSPAQPRDESYYATLFSHLKGDGPAHVAHWMMRRDLSAFRPKGVAPHTDAKREMRLAAMDEVHQILWDLHDNAQPPFDTDLLSMRDLEQELPDRLQRVKDLNKKLTTFVRDHLGAVRLKGVPVNKSGKKANLWAWRNQKEWESLPKAEVARRYNPIPHRSQLNWPQFDDPMFD